MRHSGVKCGRAGRVLDVDVDVVVDVDVTWTWTDVVVDGGLPFR
jgi:hypothetical protein